MVPAGGSRWQQQAGVEDSPELFLSDVQGKTHGQADPAVARALTSIAPRLVAWLADYCSVPLELVTDFNYPGHSRHRCHSVPDRSGRTLHRLLLDAAESEEQIDLLVPCRLADLVVAPSGGVIGARMEVPGRSAEEVRARSVVLATNGFGANRALVARYLPQISEGLYFGGDASTGDALLFGHRLGADMAGLDAYQGHGSVAVPQSVLLTWATVMHGGVVLNAEGQRFGDESAGYSEFAGLVLAQPDEQAWVVYDAVTDAACQRFADYQRCRETGAVQWANDCHELADLVGAPIEALAETFRHADSVARGRASDAFGRQHWDHPLHPPYAAVRVTGALFHTQGGLRVDEHAAVLRGGRPIPGLYAAGGAAVGMSGHGASGYLAGNGLLAALGLGYLAGEAVAV